MDAGIKEAIKGQVQGTTRKFLQDLCCVSAVEFQTMCDTDLSPLQPKIGDHIMFTVSGVIRLEDYLAMNPMEPIELSPEEQKQLEPAEIVKGTTGQ